MDTSVNLPENKPERFRHYAVAAAAAWTLIAVLSLAWTYYQHKKEIVDVALAEARTAFHRDVVYRLWNAKHGGVYVPVSKETQPSPFLSGVPERDITTPSGKKLTLMNPAYMTRQVHELAREKYGMLANLTSLKPIRPDNAADQWETKALRAFEEGKPEFSSIGDINGEQFMRLMRPLITEDKCLKCHEVQGYRVGDIRGGLSVAVPMDPLWAATRTHIVYNWIGHGLLWTLGMALIVWGAKKLSAKTDRIAEREFRYRLLFNNSNDAIFVHEFGADLPGKFIEVNDVACQRLGYSREELLALSPADIDDAVSQNNMPEITGKLSSEKNALFEAVHVAKDGNKIPVEINAHLFEINGRPAVLSIARDISERKRSEEIFQLERNKLKGIMDSLPDGVYITGQGHDIEYINPVIEKEFGPVRGRKCYEYFHDRTEACPWCKNEEVFSGKSVRWEWQSFKTGKTYDLFDTPVRNENGSVSKLEMFHDITERKRAEEEQQRLQAQLLQAHKMESVGRLAGGIAHDFNNILTSIIGYSELTLMGLPETSPLREPLKTIKESGERAAVLTRQLLAFSRKQVLNMKAVNLNTVIGNINKMLVRMIGEDVSLECHTESATGNVLADPAQIEQVLMNLAVNARDAMPIGGRLIIRTENIELNEEDACRHEDIKAGRYVKLSVTDTGVGMLPEVQKRIFEPFFTMKDEGKGTGLGLAMVYGIVKQHGGHISVSSELGQGTKFSIYLPIVHEYPEEEKAEKRITMPCGKETILVVDDEAAIVKLVRDVFQPLGYKILEASGGVEALKASDSFEGDINLVLVDIVMPGMNGSELAGALRARRPGIKTVFMSGYPDKSVLCRDILKQGTNYIQKPLVPTVLANRLREILDAKI